MKTKAAVLFASRLLAFEAIPRTMALGMPASAQYSKTCAASYALRVGRRTFQAKYRTSGSKTGIVSKLLA